MFFLVYDTLNSLGAAALLAVAPGSLGAPDAGVALLPTALHLFASSVATVPSNLIRTPAEVVKQRLQVSRRRGQARRRGNGSPVTECLEPWVPCRLG